MRNTADLAMVQKTIIHRGSLLKGVAIQGVLYQSILNAKLTGRKKLGRKMCTRTGMTASLRILPSKADTNTWESFTMCELKLQSVHQESPRSDIFRKRDTKPLLKQKHLSWAIPDLLSAPKSSFQMKVIFAFNLEIKVPESGGRSGEAQYPCCLKSSVKFPQSVMIWAAMLSAGVGPLCF